MIWKCGTVILCCLMGFTPSVQKKSLTPTGREASQFDAAGPFTIGNDLTRTQQAKVAAEVKQFIWSHWEQRRRGKVRVVAYTIEGNRSSTLFLVEPDAKGDWRVRTESIIDWVALVPKPKQETRAENYYEVDRMDIKSWHAVPNAEERDATTYALRFINKGKGVQWDY